MSDKERLQAVRDVIAGRKRVYGEELTAAQTEVEEFVFSQLIALLDEVSSIAEEE
jgi:hypothetical protein